MIDVFSKFAVVVPIKEKNAEDIMAAIFKGFELMEKTTRGPLHGRGRGIIEHMGPSGIRAGKGPTHHRWNCLLRREI